MRDSPKLFPACSRGDTQELRPTVPRTPKRKTDSNRLNLPACAGRAGEAAAANILRSLGYEVIRTNFRLREGEIGIVTRNKGQTVFVEVKTRRSSSFGLLEESLPPAKTARLITAVQSYLEQAGESDADWRIDLIENAVTE
jgi:putative endonuclease